MGVVKLLQDTISSIETDTKAPDAMSGLVKSTEWIVIVSITCTDRVSRCSHIWAKVTRVELS